MGSGVLRHLLRPAYHRLFRIGLRIRIRWADCVEAFRTPACVPLPPASLRYRVSESLSRESFLRIGAGCAKQIEQQVQSMGGSLADAVRVLDFGCGCGRTLRWLIESYPDARFYGTDVDPDSVSWCDRNLSGAVFRVNGPEPPLQFEPGSFDIVYCFSVFTHLSERMQDLWLEELRRVLKPGGILVITVHGERAAQGLDEQGAVTLERSGFLHRKSRKLLGLVPEWYNTSWHSKNYILRRLELLFTDVRYTVVYDGIQDFVSSRVG